MTKKTKRHIIASVGTALLMLLLLLILWLARMMTIVPEQEEGVEVAFGEVENAGGYMEEQSEVVPLPTEPATPPVASSDNELLTQDDEEALALQRQQREQREREKLEREQREREQREREAAEAAERAKQQEAVNRANELGALFGQTGNDGGAGDTQGNGRRGNPVGHGSVGGRDPRINGLDGRNTRDGKLPEITECRPSGPCKVVVQIRLDRDGNVIVSSSSNAIGTNTGDTEFIRCVENALRQTKWTPGDGISVGDITYNITQQMIQ